MPDDESAVYPSRVTALRTHAGCPYALVYVHYSSSCAGGFEVPAAGVPPASSRTRSPLSPSQLTERCFGMASLLLCWRAAGRRPVFCRLCSHPFAVLLLRVLRKKPHVQRSLWAPIVKRRAEATRSDKQNFPEATVVDSLQQ